MASRLEHFIQKYFVIFISKKKLLDLIVVEIATLLRLKQGPLIVSIVSG